MSTHHPQAQRDQVLSRTLVEAIHAARPEPIRLMEVCGTHTTAIFRSGIRSLLPTAVTLLSGPGCPVCVTSQNEIDAFVQAARLPGVTLTTFGDLLRVPGSGSSLMKERASGRDIRVVYSALDALEIAAANPDRRVVFLGVGFETTAPTIAASVLTARERGISNYLVFASHKRVPPVLDRLMGGNAAGTHGFILPGHVSVIIGVEAYRPLVDTHQLPCVICGFEPNDILLGVLELIRQRQTGQVRLVNGYRRAVRRDGNPKARQTLAAVFETGDAAWRGIGVVPGSGLQFREPFAGYDARRVLGIQLPETPEPTGCACGEILTGVKTPPECALYRKRCTPLAPVGPCMVSSEGTCAAYFRYHAAGQ